MNILSIPYFAGGLSHLIPLCVLQRKYMKNYFKNYFLVNNHLQTFLNLYNISPVPISYFEKENLQVRNGDFDFIRRYVIDKQKEAFKKVKPEIIIEDMSLSSPLIAEENNIPRISVQRTGVFRSIDKKYRKSNHVHSIQKDSNFDKNFGTSRHMFEDKCFLNYYAKPKVKIIPGIRTIECLPVNVKEAESYFYSGPLIVKDRPSKKLLIRLNNFMNTNKNKPIVFISTGTVDKTPIDKFVEFFVKKNYAIITTCNSQINHLHHKEVFYNKILPLHYICGISDLVIHQCGSGMYHYPIMNRTPSLTLGTQCYDREDIAQRLQQLGVSGHIPHPDDDPNYWGIFIGMIERFENENLVSYKMMDELVNEIDKTMENFKIEEVFEYALSSS